MKFIPASELTFPLIEAFIQPYEFSCVLLASYVRKRDSNIFIVSKNDSVTSVDDFFGVIYFEKTLLHCLPFYEDSENFEIFLSLLLDFMDGKHLRCINGESNTTELILEKLKTIDVEQYQANQYKLMTLETKPMEPPEKLSCDDEIRRCYDGHFEELFDLQKMYLSKEVAPVGKVVTDAECSISLRQILKNQLCFALYSNDEVVAKANTNAIGFTWVQIGGVYTHPLYRKNYYAWNLVASVCHRVLKTGRKVCLFVKEKNNPAIQLYTRMGFTEVGNYKICYF